MLLRISFLIFSFLLLGHPIFAQKNKKNQMNIDFIEGKQIKNESDSNDYYKSNYLRYENFAYQPVIKSVQLTLKTDELQPPIIRLNSDDQLLLRFDDLSAEFKNLSYTFIHCNADWQPSILSQTEYMQGFTENFITDYTFSLNTLQKFIHYQVEFPNSNTQLTRSGNYIIFVFQDNNKEKPVLTRRFILYEDKVQVTPRVKRPTLTPYRNYKQEVDFTINHSGYPLINPYSDLKVVVMQNFRWDNAITNLKPLFIKGEDLIYDYEEENVFPGNNEFRHFDIKSLRFQSDRINTYIVSDTANHAYLLTDEKRSYSRYSTIRDINGNYVVRVQEGADNNRDADYVWVHFRLNMPLPLTTGSLYVYGALTDWTFKEEAKLKYDERTETYYTSLYLKQGYYNYVYSFLEDGKTGSDDTTIEGMHFETENEYSILVYHRPPGRYFDEVIAFIRFNSMSTF